MVTIALSRFIIDPADYTIIKLLGKGSCGEAYLARHKSGREVAYKKLFPVSDAKDHKLFVREVVVPLQLDLPGIVKMIGFRFPGAPPEDDEMAVPEEAVIVTELMSKGCLMDVVDKFVRKEPTPGFGPTEFSKCIFGIAATMAKVHDFGAIHRDLKPANVFLDERYEPRVADFGLSRLVTNAVNMTMAVGTPLFMAPELYADSEDGGGYTHAVDVYAFGVLVYQMFTKKLAMDDGLPTRSPQQMMMRILNGARLARQPEIPPPFWELIQNCWTQAPTERWKFSDIVTRMKDNMTYTLPGTDEAKYYEYQRRMTAAAGAMNPALTRSMRPGGGPQVKTALSVSILARERGGIFQEEAAKGATKGKKVVRYDFTRSKYKRPG
jgi:serine/threonine protein kinase